MGRRVSNETGEQPRLEAGVINPTEGLGDGQCIHVSTEQFCNAGKANYGAVGLVEALKVELTGLIARSRPGAAA